MTWNAPYQCAMSGSQRLAELGEILAVGMVRLQMRKSSQKTADFGESSLDFTGHQSGHPTPSGSGEMDG